MSAYLPRRWPSVLLSLLFSLVTVAWAVQARAGNVLPVQADHQDNTTIACGSCGSSSTGMGLSYLGQKDGPDEVEAWLYAGLECAPGKESLAARADAYCSSHGLNGNCATPYYGWGWNSLVAEINSGRPFVAHTGQYGGHYVLVIGWDDGGNVHFNDPAKGYTRVFSWGDFSSLWYGSGVRFLIDRCTPSSCAAQGVECGAVADGCGGTLDCGNCNGKGTCVEHRCNWFPKGTLDVASCTTLAGWAQDDNTPTESLEVHIAFDGVGFEAAQIVLPANKSRPDLCEPLGSCTHAFESLMPVSLRNSKEHTVSVLAKDSQGGPPAEISGSPKKFTCDPPSLPLTPSQGVLRAIPGPDGFKAWKFSALWDVASYPDKALADFTRDDRLPAKPSLVKVADLETVWLLDNNVRRVVPNAKALQAWRFDEKSIEVTKQEDLARWRVGEDLRDTPFLLKGSGDTIFVLDTLFGYEDRAAGEPVLREQPAQPQGKEFRSSEESSQDAAGCACRQTIADKTSRGFEAAVAGIIVAFFLIARRSFSGPQERRGS